MMYKITAYFLKLYTRITCRIDKSVFRDVPQTGPMIVIINHTGQIEVPVMFSHLYPRKTSAWAKAESWDYAFLRWIFNLWGIIPVQRGEADMKALKSALKALASGVLFGIAPEGTRNKNGKLLRAMPGTVLLALHSGAPILPIAHWGGENYLKNLKRFKRTDFHVKVGKAFVINTEGMKVTAEIRQQIADEMMYEIAKMLPEEYRGEYSDLSKATQKFIRFV